MDERQGELLLLSGKCAYPGCSDFRSHLYGKGAAYAYAAPCQCVMCSEAEVRTELYLAELGFKGGAGIFYLAKIGVCILAVS